MITNYVSKREISLKKGGVQAASLTAPQLQRNITLRTASFAAPQLPTRHHHSHRLGAFQCREPPVSCSPIAL